jgi:hypothetical protein
VPSAKAGVAQTLLSVLLVLGLLGKINSAADFLTGSQGQRAHRNLTHIIAAAHAPLF